VPAHRQRSGVHEARVAGLAITLSVAALILIMVYVIGDYAHRVVVDAGDGPIGVQLLVRKLGPTPFGVGYAPRGPVGAHDPKSLHALTEALARLGRQERLSHITMDPGWACAVPAAGAASCPSRDPQCWQKVREAGLSVPQFVHWICGPAVPDAIPGAPAVVPA